MWTAEMLIMLGATFFVAGAVKGVVGLGLPTVTLAVLTAVLGLKPAMALLLMPSLVTNFWQALVGGAFWSLMRRMVWMLVAVAIGTWVGVRILAVGNTGWLSALLGLLLVLYSVSGLLRPAVPDLRSYETWMSPVAGSVNGVLTGMTGSFVFPGVLYLQGLKLSKDELVQAMGILFTASTLVLGLALGGERLIPQDLALLSCFGVVPALIGMATGQAVRKRLSDQAFRKALYVALLILGGFIIYRAAAL